MMFLAIIVLLISVIFAWFSMSNQASGNLVGDLGELRAEYELYRYKNSLYQKDSVLSINQLCNAQIADGCYEKLEDNQTSTTSNLFGEYAKLLPGDEFTFALKIKNVGDRDAHLLIELGQVFSKNPQGEKIAYSEKNAIHRAFQYEVAKIAYVDSSGMEGMNIRESIITAPFLKHFNDYPYPVLAKNIELDKNNINKNTVIIYFHISFSSSFPSFDENGSEVNNSNAYIKQKLVIEQIIFSLNGRN